ncbi:MAG: diguanylate cyclase [Selenomonadaceae bacterium]|nr:diguanylate cyclase [Selenomonadaceae bacterium]
MERQEMTALDAYINRVYKIIVLIIPIFCLCAAGSITLMQAHGWYPPIDPVLLMLFDVSTVAYLLMGIYFIRTGFGNDGIVIPRKLKAAKITMATIVVIQWNAISYLWPFTDFWAYLLLFTIVEGFFFDSRLVAWSSLAIVLSLIVSWVLGSDMLLPERNDLFMTNLTFRIIGLVLMLLSINIITYFGGKFLVEELEKYVNYDTLTHLLNRRSMDNYLQAAKRHAETGKATFCLMLMDIDDFKKVNDTYGHDCGDEVLKYVAGVVSTDVRKNDNVFRWGGEEILVLLNADEEKAIAAA